MTLLPTFAGGRPAAASDLGSLIDKYDTPYGDYLGAKLDQGWWGALNGAVLGGFYKRYGLPSSATDELFSDPAEQARVRAFRTTPTVSVPPPFRQSEQELIESRLQAKGIEYLTEDRWKAGPWYRDMPFEPYMTEARAKAKAETFDLNRYRDWRIQQRQNGVLGAVTGFGAQLVGGVPDPINFVGFGGFAAKGATLLRTMGRGALEVGAVTAAAEPFLAKNLDYWGEDLTFADAVLDVAMGAATGGLFAGGGRVVRLLDEAKLRRQQAALGEARQALDEAASLSARAETLGTGYDPATARAAPEALARLNDTVEALATHQDMTAYHGSPHVFDRFSLEGVGKGEGAQAYGYGLYFAENPKVAGFYQNAVALRHQLTTFQLDGVPSYNLRPDGYPPAEREAIAALIDNRGDAAIAETALRRDGKADALDALRRFEAEKRLTWNNHNIKGHLYEVRLNVKPGELLDLDAPRDQQSGLVQAALKRVKLREKNGKLLPPNEAEAKALLAEGVKGLRYLDATSRRNPFDPALPTGTRNTVIFDDRLVSIASRNGEPVSRPAPEVETLARETAEPAPDPLKDAEADPDVQAYRELEQAGAVKAEDKRAFDEANAQVAAAENIEKAYQQASLCLARAGA